MNKEQMMNELEKLCKNMSEDEAKKFCDEYIKNITKELPPKPVHIKDVIAETISKMKNNQPIKMRKFN